MDILNATPHWITFFNELLYLFYFHGCVTVWVWLKCAHTIDCKGVGAYVKNKNCMYLFMCLSYFNVLMRRAKKKFSWISCLFVIFSFILWLFAFNWHTHTQWFGLTPTENIFHKKTKHTGCDFTMSDTEAGRESLPSISDLSINPQSTPSTKTTDAKVKKEVEKGLNTAFWSVWPKMFCN